ncbi:NADH-quinone oxidoreductase subunit C [Pleionea sediminis]|uniref:NADH-quinone oxidoreductase subunit C n=1 Tax=Pleionea sediminis TaxID=2569479 RepID=UPI001FE4CECB|nr:NADH-quinone oxidoreductase subunit C [Pleionea sediminis]
MDPEAIEQWKNTVHERVNDLIVCSDFKFGELTVEVESKQLIELCRKLRDEDGLHFEQLIDLCGVDYSTYGQMEWETDDASGGGFSRGVEPEISDRDVNWQKPRFAVVYHLLSITNGHRLRVRCFVPEKTLIIPSVTSIWASANWYEREAFDLFGIRFENHDDLRRLLTDYGFSGHPFRKDFPLIGQVELRYDATEKRCIYEPVSIEPRVLVPRVIRHDARYVENKKEEQS